MVSETVQTLDHFLTWHVRLQVLLQSVPRQLRWCKKCNATKPPLSHHCAVCKECVLNMDHHCPWVSNCVGYRNYSYFYLFLFYLWLGCVYSVRSLPAGRSAEHSAGCHPGMLACARLTYMQVQVQVRPHT